MTDDLGARVRAALQDRADAIRASENLPERALTAGRRRGARRRAAVVTGTVLVITGVAVSARGLWSPGGVDPLGPTTTQAATTAGNGSSAPTAIGGPTPTVARTPLDIDAQQWYDELPVGPSVDVSPRLQVSATGEVSLVTAHGAAALGDDTDARYTILDSTTTGTLVARIERVSAPTPSRWSLIDIGDAGNVTVVATGAGAGTTIEAGLITGAAADPSGSGSYAISTIIDPNLPNADGPDYLTIVRPGEPPTARLSLSAQGGRVLGWTSRGVLVDTNTGLWLWDPGDPLAKAYPVSDPLARVVPGKPDLVLVHRETDNRPDEETIEPASCLSVLDVTTHEVREITCGDDPPGAGHHSYPNAVNQDGTIVMAPIPMTFEGERIGAQMITAFGVFPQQRFSDTDTVIKPAGMFGGAWWQWWVRCDVRTARCEQAPLPPGIRAISLY